MKKKRMVRRGLATLLALSTLAGAPLLGRAPLARADTFTVCPSGCGYTTIQEAVAAAVSQDQTTGQNNTVITVGAGTYTGGISFPGDPTQAPGTRGFTLQAAPGAQVTITGNNFNQVLTAFNAPTVTIQGITIENGLGQIGGGLQITSNATVSLIDDTLQGNRAQDGAGIYVNNSTLNLTDVTFENNDTASGTTQDSHGGGLYASNSTVTIKNSSFLGNVVQGGPGADGSGAGAAGATGHSAFGGAIYTTGGSLTIDASTFFGNRAQGGTGGDGATGANGGSGGAGGQGGNGDGGALYAGGSLTVTRGTFSGNAAQGGLGGNGGQGAAPSGSGGDGGSAGTGNGGALLSTGGPSAIANSTFTANAADGNDSGHGGASGGGIPSANGQYQSSGSGGAIDNAASGSALVLDNDTIASNTLPHGGQGTNIYNPVTLANTILATTAGPSCNVAAIDQGHNLQFGDTSCGATIRVGDPKLGPLQHNGGPTQTMALGAGSAAIGQGSVAVCQAAPVQDSDERGYPRGDQVCDIGAYDSQSSPSGCPTASVASSAYTQAVLADHPLGYWRLDEPCKGPVSDLSGHGISGETLGGVTPGQPGALHSDTGTATAFDGQSGAISLGDPTSLQPAQVSVEAWVKTTSTPNAVNTILRKRFYGYDLYLNASGQPTFSIDDSNATPWLVQGPTPVADGTWHYLVGTYDGMDVRLYVDGALVRTRPAGTIYYQPDLVAIGRDGGYAGSYFTGQIDEVAIYGAALSQTQVQAHYTAGSKQVSTTTLTITPNPVVVGQPYTLTATVRGAGATPSGTVNFCFNYQGNNYCTPEPLTSSGVATEAFTAIQNSEAPAGTFTEAAVYLGDATHAGSTSAPISEVIAKARTSVSVASSANPAAVGQTVTFTATVHVLAPGSGTPTGTVTFKDGGTVLGTAAIGLHPLSITTSSLAVGTHGITAVYSGDTQFIGSASAPLSQVVVAAQTRPVSLFTTQIPAGTYHGKYELGVEFRSQIAGHVTGLRFYKAPGETGTHTGHLWSATGSLLGTVIFSGETASGWQTATLATPIAIAANTTYVASYNSNTAFGATVGGLKSSVTNGPLATVTDGKDGPYTTRVGTFPTTASGGNNYFADVVFVSP